MLTDQEVSVEAFLSRIEDQTVLNKVNLLRNAIKSLSNNIDEYSRKWHWIMYKSRWQFCGIDTYHNHVVLMVKLNENEIEGQNLKFMQDYTPNQSKIYVDATSNLEQLIAIINRSFQRKR